MIEEKSKLADTDFSIFKDKNKIDLSEDYPLLQYILAISGIPCMPKGELQAVKAKAKQGKTHTLLCLMIALLKDAFLCLNSRLLLPKICYFATEEHQRSVAMLVKKVHKACGWKENESNDSFHAYSLRTSTVEERIKYIQNQIESEKPDVVFIDGIRDLVKDFNSIDESSNLIQFLMKLSADNDCATVCVLHTNKAANDSNMRGHLGTELLNKCSDVWEVEKKNKNGNTIFQIAETDCRNMPTGEWAFMLDDNAMPVAVETDDEHLLNKQEQRLADMRDNFQYILAIDKALNYTQLVKEYQEVAGVKEPTAKKHIGEAAKSLIIIKGKDENYRLP